MARQSAGWCISNADAPGIHYSSYQGYIFIRWQNVDTHYNRTIVVARSGGRRVNKSEITKYPPKAPLDGVM